MKLRALCVILCPFVALPLSSCTGLEPAIVGAALSGAKSGVTLFQGAEVWDFREAEYESVCDAIDRAAERLEVVRLNERRDDDKGRYWVYLRYLGDEKLEVEVTRVTEAVTSVEIDTRSKNQQGMATLFVEVMLDELGEGAADSRLRPVMPKMIGR